MLLMLVMQVACYADQHLRVKKHTSTDGRVATVFEHLHTPEQRTEEVAVMLGRLLATSFATPPATYLKCFTRKVCITYTANKILQAPPLALLPNAGLEYEVAAEMLATASSHR